MLLHEDGVPKLPALPLSHVHVQTTRQQQFDEALMEAAHGVARCLTIACQGLQEQHNEPLNTDDIVAALTLGRHFANCMWVPIQDFTDLLMRCTTFRPKVPGNHPRHLRAVVHVVDNAWRDEAGLEMLNALLVAIEDAGVALVYTQSTTSPVASYTLGRHVANCMWVPMHDCTYLLRCCSPVTLGSAHTKHSTGQL